jgi:hypothetical protein
VTVAGLAAGGGALLLFACEECLTSAMALRRLGPLSGAWQQAGLTATAVFEDPLEVAVRVARRLGWQAGVAAEDPVGAGNYVTSCDLRILADQAAGPVPAQNPDVRAQSRWMRAAGRWSLLQCPVRAMEIVVAGVLAEHQPKVPFAGDQHPVRALAAAAGNPSSGDRVRASNAASLSRAAGGQ